MDELTFGYLHALRRDLHYLAAEHHSRPGADRVDAALRELTTLGRAMRPSNDPAADMVRVVLAGYSPDQLVAAALKHGWTRDTVLALARANLDLHELAAQQHVPAPPVAGS